MKVICYDGGAGALGKIWAAGAKAYRARGFARAFDVKSLEDVCKAVASLGAETVDEVQIWSHGHFGAIVLGGHWYRASDVARERGHLYALRGALTRDAHVWFRSCGTFGTFAGHAFALALASEIQRAVVGHTHLIGFPWHSGGHALRPNEAPAWSEREGVAPSGAMRKSWPTSPNTIPFSATGAPSTWWQK